MCCGLDFASQNIFGLALESKIFNSCRLLVMGYMGFILKQSSSVKIYFKWNEI